MDLLDPLLSRSITNLTSLVERVAQTTANFKPELKLLSDTLEKISSIIQDIVNANRTLDRSEEECKMLKDEIEKATKLVIKCSKVKRNITKKFTYSLKLKDFNGKLLRFFQIEVHAIQARGIMETLSGVNDVKLKMDLRGMRMRQRTSWIGDYSGSMSTSVSKRTDQSGWDNMEREKYGWRVPALPTRIVAFNKPLAKLKAEVVAGIDSDNRSVLVVAAAGGCGKTTLVKMLCHDPDMQEKFGGNIFFVTVSETPDFMVTVNDLFNPNPSKPEVLFQGIEDAKNKLENFVNEKVSGPMLLVLDDVWSDSFIDNFPSNNKRCKILVTSRTAFTNYDVFRFDPLTENDAKTLFCRSAFPDGGMRPSPVIDENLVNQMVACCKKHPLTLSVVGRSLNGKDKLIWESTLKELSQDSWSVLDLHKDVITPLQRSFEALDDDLKQCFLDFGLFPEDEKIPVSSLLNMWVHLYNHDDDGVDTLTKIFELSHRNLVDIMTTRNDSGARVNHYDQQYVIQHDLLRELAINLNNKLPLVQRSRLIIDAQGEDLPASIEHVQEPIQARILSLCTGESFTSQWCNMEVPNLEVLFLNLMSETYTLPQFLAGLQNFKILNITNHGLYPTQFNNFNLLTSSYNLTSIRLEGVAISPSILSLINLQKVSFIMCKIGSSFKKRIIDTRNIWPQLVEIEIDDCQDLVEFPGTLCNSVHLKKISITNCNRMHRFNEEFGDLINLEALSLRSCTALEKLPEEIWRLEKLSVVDISDCLSLSGLPEKIGKLGGLRMIYMNGCIGVHELPESVEDLCNLHVVCNEEIAYQWREYSNVEIHLVEDSVKTLTDIDLYNKREKYGWRVPALPTGIVAFNKPLAKLKEEIVAGIDSDNRSVLVVAAAGGCGKTTLVKMLCHHPEIKENFGENIFFVTVSETPNFMVIVYDLLYPNSSGLPFQSNEDAKNRLKNFFSEKTSGPMLLVLDDVWSDSFIEEVVPSKKTRCQVLVTSRTAFKNYDVFRFDPLNKNDAKILFCRSAFTKGGKRPSPVIDDNLVNQMVACCKRHPLTLSVVGRSLNGKDKLIWESTLKDLSRGSKSVLDLHKDLFTRLERSFEALDDDNKDCFLDFGLFPENQRIPVSALLNMWVHLYNHDDDGVDTLAKIFELSYRNLVDIMNIGFRNYSSARVNHCDQQFVTQHDLLRQIAIHLTSKLPLPQRSRLIIDVPGEGFPTSIKQVQEPMQARILSISTGESFTSQWCNIEVPDLEVLILNLMSKTYTLPQFLAGLPRLKILNITNYDVHPTQFNNFHYLTSSHNLTRIRLERVTISPFILSLVNLQKVSFIMCSMGNSFKILINDTTNIWPQIVEIEIDYCQDLVEFPTKLCNSVHLKKISITNCNEMCGFNEEFGDLVNLETLSLRSCTKLEKLPESIWRLEKLIFLDISDCLNLNGLPEKMGKLGNLRMIYMKCCIGVYELPKSIEELSHVHVVCDEEIAYRWRQFGNVEIDLVEEDRLQTLAEII